MVLSYQARVRFVDQGSRLERMTRPLITEVTTREFPKLRVKQRYQTVQRALIPSRKVLEQELEQERNRIGLRQCSTL
jgi:hypothetical protein